MLDEMALRRPDFAADVPVILLDGQTWNLPKPRIRFRASMVEGKIVPLSEHSFGVEYLSKVEAYYRSLEDESEGSMDRFMVACFDLATSLLIRNYDLAFDEAASLFCFDFSGDQDPKIKEVQEAFLSTALGRAEKKTSEDGSPST